MLKYAYPLLIATFLISCHQPNNDMEAIKTLLVKESATWRARDVKGHAACWHIQPYSRILVATGDGHVINVPPAKIVNPLPEQMGDGGTSVNSNYTFSIHDNNAWVGHDEVSISPTGQKNYTSKIRLLEKIDGVWLIVGESIMVNKSH